VALLGAFAARSLGALPDELLYQALNAVGSLGILVVAAKKRAWQPATVNAVWCVVSVWCAVAASSVRP
jgi:hypothetical protein